MTTHHLETVADGVHLWRATHPEWNTTTERVACYALEFDDGLLLVDPLLGGGDAANEILAELRELAAGRSVHCHVTIPYHVRDSEPVARALGGRIHGHAALARRLDDPDLAVDALAEQLPWGVEAIQFGSPRRNELLLHSPAHRALVVGDLAIGTADGLRIWQDVDGHEAWYADRFLPTLAPLTGLDLDLVLVTHGTPVLRDGSRAIRDMIDSPAVASIKGQLAGGALPPVRAPA